MLIVNPLSLQTMAPWMWLIAFVLLLIIEAAVPGLISIWFALGAIAALIASAFHAPMWLQVTVFIVVSIASLIFTRPLAMKYVNGKTKATNADRVLFQKAVVTEEVNNLMGTGAAKVDGKEWTARSKDDGMVIPKGATADIDRIDGVKLILKYNAREEIES